ncbi:trace amine-associated receptor 13c-like [Xyrauchen texanus]|uniref:trace amine-associated receptor 13c-like n=1 Tax=Xyrauchen texanus TaxID=154827 RepID=UPI002241ED39|nr:trace amine-associated receptor 13c-like [Xyrauchen texanus]
MANETVDHETQYCFPAINSSCIKGKHFRHEYYVIYMSLSLLSAWTAFLNLLVIISISHFKKLHTPTNLLILSLAVADMLVGLIVMPMDGIRLIETCWYFGDTACGLFLITISSLLSVSLCNLVFIAVDRYMAVCHPLLYPQKITTTKTVLIICHGWCCSIMYNIALTVSNGFFEPLHRKDVCNGACTIIISFAWTVTDLFVSFLFPCILITALYLRIFYIAQQQVKVINSIINSGKSVTEVSVKRKSERKAALTLGIIVTVYLFSWIPYYICSFTGNTNTSSATLNALLWTMHINSGLNPLIYALFYPWFRKSVKQILTLRIFRPESSMTYFTDYHS